MSAASLGVAPGRYVPGGLAGRRRQPSPWLLVMPLGIALAFLPPYTTAALTVALAGAAVLLIHPRWALYLLALTVPYQSLLSVRLNGMAVTVTEGIVAILIAGWVTQIASRRARPPSMTSLVAVVSALVVCFALTVFVASDLNMAAKEMLKWIELAAVFLAGTSLLETPQQRRTMLLWLMGAAASQALFGLYQSVARIGPAHFLIGGVVMRAYGHFEQPNPYGGYMGLTVPLAVSMALFGLERGFWRLVATAVALLTGTALLLTLSRGAWVAQIAALLVVLTVNSARARRALATGSIFGIVLLIAMWPLLPGEITDRASSVVVSAVDIGSVRNATVTPENWAVLERLSQWYAGWQMFLSNPLLGVGIGNYNAAYDDFRLDQWPVALGHAHNHYLTVAAEAGLLGFVAYLGFWATVLRTGITAIRQASHQMDRAVAVGILGSLTAFATHNLFDVLFVHGMGVTIALLVTLLHCVPLGLFSPPHLGLPWQHQNRRASLTP